VTHPQDGTTSRASGDLAEPGYRFGRFELLPHRRRLLSEGAVVPISPRALSLLILLVERHGRLVSKDEIYTEIWSGRFVEEHNLVVHVSALRKQLGPDVIDTIPGRGYRFTATLVPPEGAPPEPTQPAAAPTPRTTNLPQRLTALIGRDAELAELTQRLASHRLVTLAGPSGIGKTRLAIELGWRLQPSFRDSVWLIDLAPLSDPAVLTSAVATALGIELRSADPVETIATAIARRQTLLIFDNCEHLVGAVAALIEALLQRVPALSVLATSQEILRLPGEQIYRLNPLALPPPQAAEIAGFGAIDLFVARAHAADRRFALTGANAAGVIEICSRLDGIPLALEMAAARVPLLGIEGLCKGLGERLRMLGGSARTTEWRHRTLRDMVAWSYGLLNEAEQQMFRQLGVFAGNFSLEAALAVAGHQSADRWDMVDQFGKLVDKSLVAVEADEPLRYRLLETMRCYAVEELKAGEEHEATAEHHARYFVDLLDQADQVWEKMTDKEWGVAYSPEIDNVRTALEWTLEGARRPVIACTLAGGAGRLWHQLALLEEGRRYLERAAGLQVQKEAGAAARLERWIGNLWYNSDPRVALTAFERSALLYRQANDQVGLAHTLSMAGVLNAYRGNIPGAKACLGEASEILASSGLKKAIWHVTNALGIVSSVAGETSEARNHLERAINLAKEMGDISRKCYNLMNLIDLEVLAGNVDWAVERGREAVDELRGVQERTSLASALNNLAMAMIVQENLSEARVIAKEALSLACEQGGHVVRISLQIWACLNSLGGYYAPAAQLLGFVDKGFTIAGTPRQPVSRKVYERILSELELVYSVTERDRLIATGAGMSEAEAVSLALASATSH
jgi:predicted ATPase/DNA-binding winged helix-turn-helix (wHTH) protein